MHRKTSDMRHLRFTPWTGLLVLSSLALLGTFTPGRAAPAPDPAPPPQEGCWNIKTSICTDCADADSKYCDPNASEGPFVSCIQTLTQPCPGFTCSMVDAKTGPPCY